MQEADSRRLALRMIIAATLASSALSCGAAHADPATYDPAPAGEVRGLKAKFVDVAGQRTRYYEYGEGEPLLLIHGGGRGTTSSANNFAPVIPLLARHYRVIAFDKSAAGMTDNPPDDADLSYQGEVKHTYNLIRTLELGPSHIVGHSSGGAVGFYLAVEHPEVVKTLTIVSHGPEMPPLAKQTKHDAAEQEQCKAAQTTYEGRACRLRLLGHTPETWDEETLRADAWMADQPKSKIAREKYAGTRAAAMPSGELTLQYRQRMWDATRRDGMQMPVMLLVGKQDTLSWEVGDPYAMMRSELAMFDILGGHKGRVKMVILNEAGHFPYREHPEQFVAEVDAFISFWRDFREQ
ncbi:MAG TPA: alpha/beta hydrolase [Steroidobacter sp.]